MIAEPTARAPPCRPPSLDRDPSQDQHEDGQEEAQRTRNADPGGAKRRPHHEGDGEDQGGAEDAGGERPPGRAETVRRQRCLRTLPEAEGHPRQGERHEAHEERGLGDVAGRREIIQLGRARFEVGQDVGRRAIVLVQFPLHAQLAPVLSVGHDEGRESEAQRRQADDTAERDAPTPHVGTRDEMQEREGSQAQAEDDRVVHRRQGLDPKQGERRDQVARALRLEEPQQPEQG